MNIAIQRRNRVYQSSRRGGKSIKTELEDAYLLLAWEVGELSEGQVSRLLGLDRLTLRLAHEAAVRRAMEIAEALRSQEAG